MLALSLLCALLAGCASAPKPIEGPVAPRTPQARTGTQPMRTPQPSKDSPPDAHAAAMEQLRVAEIGHRRDRQDSIEMALPDAESWRRVRFLGIKSLVGFRYGGDHHAVAGALVIDGDGDGPQDSQSCHRAIERWAKPWLEVFDVRLQNDAPVGFSWRDHNQPKAPPSILSATRLTAQTSSMLLNETYYASYAAYPAWPGKCLIAGFAVPERGERQRAMAARDRYAEQVAKQLRVLSEQAPEKSF